MVLPAGEHQRPGIGAGRPGRGRDRLHIGAQGVAAQIHQHARGARDVSEVGQQTVRHVGHRLGAGLGRGGSLAVGRLGHQMATDLRQVPDQAAPQHFQPGPRAAQFARHRDHRPGTGTAAQHRPAAAEITQGGDRDHPLRTGHQVAADHGRTDPSGLRPQPVGQVADPGRRGRRRRAEGDDERGGTRPHGFDVRRALGDRLPPHLVWRGPVQPEVPALDEHVGGQDRSAVGGVDDRRVVARADPDPGPARPARDELLDDGELTRLGQRRTGALGNGPRNGFSHGSIFISFPARVRAGSLSPSV